MAFAAPSIGLAGLSLPLLVYLPNFYATGTGMPLATVGFCFLAVRLLDIAFDPIVGSVMDRASGRQGRFRPWLAGATLPLMLFTYLLFNPSPGSNAGRLILSLAGLYAAWSICFVAQLGWGVALASDYRGRNAVFAWWQGLYLLGSLIISAIPMLPAFRGVNAASIGAMGWFIIVAVPVGVLIALATVPEPAAAHRRPIPLGERLRLLSRPGIARLLAVDLLLGIAVMLGGSLFFFYFKIRHGIEPGGAAVLFFLVNVGSFLGVWAWGLLGSRQGKHRAAAIAFCCYAIVLAAIQLAPIHGVASAVPLVLLFGATVPAGPVLVRSMLGDAGDAEELRSGHDQKGLIAALFANSNKLGTALGPAIGFVALGAAGFRPNAAVQTAAATNTLVTLAIGAPALLALICAWMVTRHPITARDHDEIAAALRLRQSEAAQGAAPQTLV
jgi:glycoside/pentoside/hexuronide:cation symporter, GPH family